MDNTNNNNDRILTKVRLQEKYFVRSISLVSIGICILYISGLIWRISYYKYFGIPSSMIEIPFPIVLIPKPNIVCFLFNLIFTYLIFSYHGFYQREKRSQRAKKMSIKGPLKILVDYGFRNNEKFKDSKKSNQDVLYDFFYKYLDRPENKGSDWTFDIKEFQKEALPLFSDIPYEIKESFILYELKLLAMDSVEYRDTISDSIGSLPEGSKIFEKFSICYSCIWIILILIFGIFWAPNLLHTLLCGLIGFGVGIAILKLSKVEKRYQLWHMIWLTVIILFIINHLDGYITARWVVLNSRLPIATFSTKKDENVEGLLIASFSDCYFIIPYEPNDVFRRIKIEKDEVRSISLTNLYLLRKKLEYKKQNLKNLSKNSKSKD